LQSCPHYGASRYKRNAGCRADADDEREPKKKKTAKKTTAKKRKISGLSMWYLPIIDHLRAIFRNPEDTKLMSWHASDECMKGDGKLRHPANGKQWKRFDAKFLKEFGDETRNVRFALSTDGMTPFGDLSSSHNTWPFILTIYNLPP
jgi:hypothetical protein